MKKTSSICLLATINAAEIHVSNFPLFSIHVYSLKWKVKDKPGLFC